MVTMGEKIQLIMNHDDFFNDSESIHKNRYAYHDGQILI